MQKLLQNHSLNAITQYGVHLNICPTKGLQPATDLMGLEDEIIDTPATRQITITLANAARQASRVSVSCTCKKSCANRRCRCYKNDLK
ncbi:hypothetical protein L211DRAFT_836593 [Terfezia boudieri ATCC MYA-4762]|uniref:Uncharacterized protein n=1 Tax=Terfezia boudieri ATCC MYA-4762 TaxID=1051890 RepID=A0A3N4LUB6_9PEZI|nr:hypothetical protein L211DRAFT_836593 [Terfezia boudieri ATCC MYA-4762]